jgi:hypothetical protein
MEGFILDGLLQAEVAAEFGAGALVSCDRQDELHLKAGLLLPQAGASALLARPAARLSGFDYGFADTRLVKSGFGGVHTDSNHRLMYT